MVATLREQMTRDTTEIPITSPPLLFAFYLVCERTLTLIIRSRAVRAAAVEPSGPTPPASIAPTESTAAFHIHGPRAET
jgi:hypothetical protein